MKNYKKFLYGTLMMLFFVITLGALSACGGAGGSKKYVVTFDDMYGHKTTQKVEKGKLAVFENPDVPLEEEFDQFGNVVSTRPMEITFYKWYLDQQFITEYDFNTPVTSNITLYARWITDRVVSFDTGGGSAIDNITVGVIHSQEEIETLTGVVMEKEGYAFKGWYTDSELNNPVVYPYILTGNKTLYAKWDVEGFLVTFYCINGLECKEPFNVLTSNQKLGIYIDNDGTQGIESISAHIDANDNEYGDKYYGYTFEGWYTEPTFEPSSRIDEDDYLNITINNSMNIYGNFIIKNYSITVFYNIADKPDLNGTVFQKKYTSVLLQNELMTVTTSQGTISVVNEGKKIKGWYTDEDCTKVYDFSKPVIGDFMLFVEWENISGYINVDYAGGSVENESFTELEETPGNYIEDIYEYLNLETPVRKGYEFKGWSYQYDDYYRCTWFIGEDGSLDTYSCTDEDDVYIYTNSSGISRWYLNGDPTSEIAPHNFTYLINQTDNKQINAVWEGTEYTVILNYYNGTTDADHTLDGTYAYDSTIYSSSIDVVEKVGYQLKGFALESGLTSCAGGVCFSFPITLGTVIDAGLDDEDTIRLYAVYEPKLLDVIFNSNGGSFGQSGAYYILPSTAVNNSHIIKYNTTWTYEFMVSVFGNSVQNPSLYLAKTDYQFVGWSTDKTATTEEECDYVHKLGESITFTNTSPITYYAIWRNDAKTFKFNGFEYDESSISYISKVTDFSANIGLSINVYSYYKNQVGTNLSRATSEIVNGKQFVGWYYCLASVQDCVANSTNRINEDTYISVQANLEFYAEYASTKLSYRLVDTGVSKHYTVSGLYSGINTNEYIEVEIPSYYMGYTVNNIDDGVFNDCNDINKLILPSTMSNSAVKGKFVNSLKIVDITLTKDILGYLGSTGFSIFGDNSTYMVSKICVLNILDLGEDSVESLISSNRIDLDQYTSLSKINNTYVESNNMASSVTVNLLLDEDATLIEVGRDGYPSAYKAGYTFKGWKLATAGSGTESYIKYTYSLDSLVVGEATRNYVVSGSEFVSFEGNLADLNNKFLIGIFEKWSNTLTIYNADTDVELYSDAKYSGELLYSDEYIDDLKNSNKLFAGYYYDSACINPVLAEDRMPYTKTLTIYAKFIESGITVAFDDTTKNLSYTINQASLNELYVARYYKGHLVNHVEVVQNSGVTNVAVAALLVPASYTTKLNSTVSSTAANVLYLNVTNLTISDIVIYGSNNEEVTAQKIAAFADTLTTITLYDNLTVAADAFDEFELLEVFDVVCTGGITTTNVGGVDKQICHTVDRVLLVSNDILYRQDGGSYHLVRVPINHSSTDFSSAQTGTSIVGDVPGTVVGIDAHAFNKCNKVTKLTIPTNIKYIGEYALANMTKLVSIDGMADVEVIANINVFENDIALGSVSISVGNGNYTSSEGVILNSQKTELVLFPKAYSFNGDRIYYVPTTVETIGPRAFDLRDSKSIILSIGPGVSRVADDAFFNISAFRLSSTSTSLAVDNGNLYKYRTNGDVEELYELVRFADASGESMYVLPNTIETVNPYAFTNASSLTRIIYDNKVIKDNAMQGVEKNILIGSFIGDDKLSVYENFEDIEIFGYNNNVYISDVSTFNIHEVYDVALENGFESAFRTWMRSQGYIVGEISNEDGELAALEIALASTGYFTINGVSSGVPSFTTSYTDIYDNFKFSRWVQSLGVAKGEATTIGVREGNVYVGEKDSGISVDVVNKGQIYMHFISEKDIVTDGGMTNSVVISKDENAPIRYSILSTKDIYLISIADVYYNGQLVPEDGNGSYKVSDNGILAKEPVTTYENLNFRGWYVQNSDVVGIYGSRVKFPLMISDIQNDPNVSPRLTAAFTVSDYVATITLKVDASIFGFVWNGQTYAAPGYSWCNMKGDTNLCSTYDTSAFSTTAVPVKDADGNDIKKLVLSDASKALLLEGQTNDKAGYWIATISTDGNNVLSHLPTTDSALSLYYRKSTMTDANTYVETYSRVDNSFFTTLDSLTLYLLPTSYMANDAKTVTLAYNDNVGTVSISTHYFDPNAVVKSGYHIMASTDKVGIDSTLVSSGINITANTNFIVINQSATRTNVTIKVEVSSANHEDKLNLVIGEYTYVHSVVTESSGKYYYTFTCKDDAAATSFLAVEGAVLNFNLVTVVEGTKSYSFVEKYNKPTYGTTTSDVFYLTGQDVEFVTSLK